MLSISCPGFWCSRCCKFWNDSLTIPPKLRMCSSPWLPMRSSEACDSWSIRNQGTRYLRHVRNEHASLLRVIKNRESFWNCEQNSRGGSSLQELQGLVSTNMSNMYFQYAFHYFKYYAAPMAGGFLPRSHHFHIPVALEAALCCHALIRHADWLYSSVTVMRCTLKVWSIKWRTTHLL